MPNPIISFRAPNIAKLETTIGAASSSTSSHFIHLITQTRLQRLILAIATRWPLDCRICAFNTNTVSQHPNVNRRSVDLDWINACVFQGLVHQSRSMPNAPLLYHKSVQTLLNQFDGFLFNSLFRRFRRSAVTSQLISSIRLIFLCVWPSVFLCVLLTANNFTLLGSLRSSDEKWTSRQVRGRPNVSPKKTKRRESLQNVVFFRTSQSASLPIALGQ